MYYKRGAPTNQQQAFIFIVYDIQTAKRSEGSWELYTVAFTTFVALSIFNVAQVKFNCKVYNLSLKAQIPMLRNVMNHTIIP